MNPRRFDPLLSSTILLFWLSSAAFAEQGPPLSVPFEELASALSCPATFAHEEHEPVLLVHGTNLTADEHWGWNYAHVLPAMGFDTCLVELPARARGDAQVAAEYVVHAIRQVAALSGRKVDVVGHSQGAMEPRWAMRWWPDVAPLVDDYVSLAGPHHGIVTTDLLCIGGSCYAAAWQFRPGSRWLEALNRDGERVDGVAMTSVYSVTDGIVQPYETSRLDGAVNFAVQDLCPGRPVDHIGMVDDAVVFALTLDALTHPGPSDPTRASVDCTEVFMPGVTAFDVASGQGRLYGNVALFSAEANDNVTAEPELKPYAKGGKNTDVGGKHAGGLSPVLLAAYLVGVLFRGASRRQQAAVLLVLMTTGAMTLCGLPGSRRRSPQHHRQDPAARAAVADRERRAASPVRARRRS